jgi:hypothetical protein
VDMEIKHKTFCIKKQVMQGVATGDFQDDQESTPTIS